MPETIKNIKVTTHTEGIVAWILQLGQKDIEHRFLDDCVRAWFLMKSFPTLTGDEIVGVLDGSVTLASPKGDTHE